MPSNQYATWTFDHLCQEYVYWSTIEPSDEANTVQEELWAEIHRRFQLAATLGLGRNQPTKKQKDTDKMATRLSGKDSGIFKFLKSLGFVPSAQEVGGVQALLSTALHTVHTLTYASNRKS